MTLTEDVKWSGSEAIPKIGSKVHVAMNGLGPAIVKGYFVQEGWLGLKVSFTKPPQWWLKQNKEAIEKGDTLGHIFGAELKGERDDHRADRTNPESTLKPRGRSGTASA